MDIAYEHYIYRAAGILPLVIIVVGLGMTCLSVLRIGRLSPRTMFILSACFILLGMGSWILAQTGFFMDQVIVHGSSILILLAVWIARRTGFERAVPSNILSTESTEQQIRDRVNIQLASANFDDQIRERLAGLDIDGPQGRHILDYVQIKSERSAIEAINRRISAFTTTMTIIGALLGAYAAFSFFNLTEIKNDANKVLDKMQDRSQFLEGRFSKLEVDVENFQSLLTMKRNQIVDDLMTNAETRWRNEIDTLISSTIDKEIAINSKELIASIEGYARKALSFGEDIEELKRQSKLTEAQLSDLKSAPLRLYKE